MAHERIADVSKIAGKVVICKNKSRNSLLTAQEVIPRIVEVPHFEILLPSGKIAEEELCHDDHSRKWNA